MNIKKHIPWPVKLITKSLLDLIPFLSPEFWKKTGLFKLGPMESPAYSYEVFRKHYDSAPFPNRGNGFTMLELGPGTSLFSALIARALGASKTYLIDIDSFASTDVQLYQQMARFLESRGYPPGFQPGDSLETILQQCSALYLTGGLASLKSIPGASVDFLWSQAVLEHVHRREFKEITGELYRVLRPGGLASHKVDLKDHLGYSLNNLRFAENTWEKIATSSYYTNRLRYSEMLGIFEATGFVIEKVSPRRWPELPVPRHSLAEPYKSMPEEELRVKDFSVVLRRK